MAKIDVLGVGIDNLTMNETVEKISDAIKDKKPMQVNTLNAEILYNALSDEKLLQTIKECHLVTPDGTGILWAASKLNTPCKERVTGIDLLTNLLERAPIEKWKIYFYGSKPEVLEKAVKNIEKDYPDINICGYTNGYILKEEQEALIENIGKERPDILFVAMGAPRQEYWIKENLGKLPPLVAIGVGGSLDVISGELKRAPKFIQKIRLEWLYRSIIEPRRFKRILVLPKFVLKVLKKSRY